ncbi:MAG TPA: hypothetical protein VGQ99_05660 [Tepidisphaeraceae bacterium]|jgi:hypothetical protein|nr:hypothetical protein [Tepidisphaeraceae bacterium]
MKEDREEIARLSGAARLAYFSPVQQYPPLADRKGAFLLAASGLLVTILFLFSSAIGRMMHDQHRVVGLGILALLGLLAVLLLISGWNAWLSFVAPIPPMPESAANFRDIARGSMEEYSLRLREMGHAEAIRAMLNYNYSLAMQGATKFRYVQRAMGCFKVALVLWMVVLMLITVAG